ncbi:MAG: sugar transferase [Woeseiaceae bacterium]|nr:sugar transferase [Woeseiaceae bacterium]
MSRRHIPVINHWPLRFGLGLLALVAGQYVGATLLGMEPLPINTLVAAVVFAWLPAIFLTDKYRHKYPQRYTTYLLASHGKAAVIMLTGLLILRLVLGPETAPLPLLLTGFVASALIDLLISLPRRIGEAPQATATEAPAAEAPFDLQPVDSAAMRRSIAELPTEQLDGPIREFLEEHLPTDSSDGINALQVIDDRPEDAIDGARTEDTGLLVCKTSLNNVQRLNLLLKYSVGEIAPGGYIAVSYTPLSVTNRRIAEKYSGIRRRLAFLTHFIWYRALPKLPYVDVLYFSPPFRWIDRWFLRDTRLRERVLSTAEVWGRLAYYGMEVVAESEGDERFVLARRVSEPLYDRKPSYYAVVALQKVGLDGEIIRLHKVRSMYPFSEFLQKRIFESHGLSKIGKFENDPRLTEYGPLIRSHWIDELPGLYDWLRGDVKLVGMRATSPHFLSLYPQELYDLYIQIKPGLVPPIFDESTDGFDDIVRIEMEYLQRYLKAPVRTDIAYFWYTFRDIVFRKVRSK